jgi:hypothetical protein
MEPVREIMPDPGYLAGVKELAHQHGALLVWDEVLTALRLGPAGAQGAFGVEPDIACLGKSLGNGMPISAIVGRREYMQHLPSVGFGMTFRGDTLSLAATRAVLEIVRTEPVAEHVAAIGERLRAEFRVLCRQLDVPWDLTGPPARMSVRFAGRHATGADDLRDLFLQECLKRGVFTNGNFLPSYAHDDDAIAETVRGVRGALEMVAAALKAGEVRGVQPLGGFPQGPRAHVAQGFVEGLHDSADGVHVGGWMLLADGAPDSIEIGTSRGIALTAARVQRPDIAQAFPRHTGALSAGFSALVPAASLDSDADQEFTILARRGGDVAFRCRVVRRRRAGNAARVEGPYWIGDGVLYV